MKANWYFLQILKKKWSDKDGIKYKWCNGVQTSKNFHEWFVPIHLESISIDQQLDYPSSKYSKNIDISQPSNKFLILIRQKYHRHLPISLYS